MGERRKIAVGHRRLAVAEKVEGAEKLLSWQRMKRDEEELGLQILRALSILRFLVVFLMFMVAPPICSCCSRGVEGKVGGKGDGFGVLDCGGGRFRWSGGWIGVAVYVR
jgi:hypothetical protein